jgi:hypothetical protein
LTVVITVSSAHAALLNDWLRPYGCRADQEIVLLMALPDIVRRCPRDKERRGVRRDFAV